MGFLDNVERGLEKALRGAFSAGSRSLQPVEIASKIRREIDDKALTLQEGRTVVPNVVDVQLGEADFERARSTWGTSLAEELCDVLIQHAISQGYTLPGPVRVSFIVNPDLQAGEPFLASRVEKNSQDEPAGQWAPAPSQETSIGGVDRHAVLEIEGRRYSLNASSVVLGRSSEADVLIDDTGVSRKHLEIRVSAQGAEAIDLGSTNGSFLDGKRIQGSVPLYSGATVTMGRSRIVFQWLPTAGGHG